jgi:hypothetical protein
MRNIMSAKIITRDSAKSHRRKSTDRRMRLTESPSSKFPKMKPTHQIVLQALEIANLALKRVVTVGEVVKALSHNEVEELKASYAKDVNVLVSVILGLLTKRGCVFSPGRIGKHCYYGSGNILNPSSSPLPDIKSRRQRVLELVRGSVAELNRAVRVGDVMDYAAGRAEFSDISPELITRDILGLVTTKDIILAGAVRGDDRGANLYLPSDLEPDLYMPKEPLTWLDLVANIFSEIWADHKKEAEGFSSRPKPITTSEVRARLRSTPNPHPNLDDPQLVVSALIQLAETNRALIRNVSREGERSARWVPLKIPDEEIDIGGSYASDFERVSEAIDRAVKRLGRPVTASDVQDEIDRDSCLRPAGKSNLAIVIAEAAKETIGAKGLPRRPRVTSRVFRAGSLKDTSYYFNDAERLPTAKSYVALRRLELLWEESRIGEDLEGIKSCSLPTVATGRAMLAVAEINHILKEIDEQIESNTMDESMREDALAFRHNVNSILNDAKDKLSFYNTEAPALPAELLLEVPGWTAAELLPIIRPLYPAARNIDRTSQLIPLLEGHIRRIHNPEYENRFVADPRAAAEFLFDRADALLYMALTFGGRECRLQARFARNELGLLRDPRFIFPALGSSDFHQRLIGVSCLAFLWSEEGNKHLRLMAVEDLDMGIRQSALWSYCFTNARDGWELLRNRTHNDPDEDVRSFARHIVEEINNNGALWEV